MDRRERIGCVEKDAIGQAWSQRVLMGRDGWSILGNRAETSTSDVVGRSFSQAEHQHKTRLSHVSRGFRGFQSLRVRW